MYEGPAELASCTRADRELQPLGRRDAPASREGSAIGTRLRTEAVAVIRLRGEVELLAFADRRSHGGLRIEGVESAERQVGLQVIAGLACDQAHEAATVEVAVERRNRAANTVI